MREGGRAPTHTLRALSTFARAERIAGGGNYPRRRLLDNKHKLLRRPSSSATRNMEEEEDDLIPVKDLNFVGDPELV